MTTSARSASDGSASDISLLSPLDSGPAIAVFGGKESKAGSAAAGSSTLVPIHSIHSIHSGGASGAASSASAIGLLTGTPRSGEQRRGLRRLVASLSALSSDRR